MSLFARYCVRVDDVALKAVERDRPVDVDLAVATFELLQGRDIAPLPRHRHDLSRDEVRRTQTARILAGAIRLFGTAGFANSTVAQIADTAKVSRRTVYDLYDSKESIFLATYECTALLMTRADAPRSEQAPSTVESLEARVRSLLELIAAVPEAATMFFLEATGAGPAVRRRRADAITQFVDVVEPTIRELRPAGAPPVSRVLCTALVAAAIELVVQRLSTESVASLPETTADIMELVRAVVGAQE